jgi:adhesin/invasin
VGQAYATRLKAQVVDQYGNPLSGLTVTFTAPASGPGGSFGGNRTATAVTNALGVATAPGFTANSKAGAFTVTAAIKGLNTKGSFNLTNLAKTGAFTLVVGNALAIL